MKITINAPLKSDDIINVLGSYSDNGTKFEFINKMGLKLEFQVTGISGAEACTLAKDIIKNTAFGKALYFSVDLAE